MRFLVLLLVAAALQPLAVVAQTAPAERAAPAKPKFTTCGTKLGDILDDLDAKAVLDRIVPALSKHERVNESREMTLCEIHQYVPDNLTDTQLAALDAGFRELKK